MITYIKHIHDSTRCRKKDQEKAFIFDHIYQEKKVTRKQIAERLKLRPTTVSNSVRELISANMVFEGTDKSQGARGRPEIRLFPNYNRLSAVVIFVVSRELRGALVNLGHEILAERNLRLPREAGNQAIYRAILELISLMRGEIHSGYEPLGIAAVLPGTVNPSRLEWISAARWPLLTRLSLDRLKELIQFKFSLNRALDAELEYLLLKNPEYREGGTLLFHWGYGIGSAYAYHGAVLHSSLGRFGEIGHIPVGSKVPRQCFCGSSGCLETEAALWALLPELREVMPEVPEHEDRFADFLKQARPAILPIIERASEFICSGLSTLCQIFYPDRILVYGPFIRSKTVFDTLYRKFMSRLPEYARGSVSLERLTGEMRGTIFGSTDPFFRETLRHYLTAGWDT